VDGGTVAVFGSGIDHIYPSENRRLAEDVATRGLILTEFPMGAPAHPQNFPLRNRIVSGLSYATVIVEGAQYSGSAITARTAMEQGREVYAVPGPITSRMSWVPNLLIKQGARLLQDAEDLLSDLPDHVRQTLLGQITNPAAPAKQEIDMDLRFGPSAPLAKAIVKAVNVNVGVKLDSLLESLEGYPPSEIVATLFELELAGMVRQLPGKQFARVW
jgi:DNA processing protein